MCSLNLPWLALRFSLVSHIFRESPNVFPKVSPKIPLLVSNCSLGCLVICFNCS